MVTAKLFFIFFTLILAMAVTLSHAFPISSAKDRAYNPPSFPAGGGRSPQWPQPFRGFYYNPFLGQYDPRSARMLTCEERPKMCTTAPAAGGDGGGWWRPWSQGFPGGGPDCCQRRCTSLKTDFFNCGACGRMCRFGQACCGGRCVNILYDPQHCGFCDNRCGGDGGGSFCSYGMCNYASSGGRA